VAQFQNRDDLPFFVISLKAGGSGLNLTAASHVVHFDRWWNPAVENQATDRAYRIGQTNRVMVHKFITSGTVEEKIDRMISEKSKLAADIVGSGEDWLGGLDVSQLKELVALEES
ncbi:MAG: helicase-related protein, partial [Cyanobacteriota bacterium]